MVSRGIARPEREREKEKKREIRSGNKKERKHTAYSKERMSIQGVTVGTPWADSRVYIIGIVKLYLT